MLSELIGLGTVDFSAFDDGVETTISHSRTLTLFDQLFHVCVFLALAEAFSRVDVLHRIVVPNVVVIKILDFLLYRGQVYFVAKLLEHAQLYAVEVQVRGEEPMV